MSAHRVIAGEYEFMAWHGRAGLVVSVVHRDDGPIGHISAGRDKALHAMMCELDAARLVLQTARKVATAGMGICELQRAIDRHDELTRDRTPPSEWVVIGGEP